MSFWALIPLKGFDRGKSRLSRVLDPAERAQLTRELFEHVVLVLQQSPSIDGVAVVSDSKQARAHAESMGAVALRDPPEARGLADVVDAALGELEARGATRALVCMGDLPELTVPDVEGVARHLDEADVVLVPDRSHEGTNVVAIQPASALPSCLGHSDSLERHRARATKLGLTARVHPCSGIAFDVDDPADLDRLRRRTR